MPHGAQRRARANLDALAVLRSLQAERRLAASDEQRVLAAWGAVPQVFDDGHAATAEVRE